MVEAGAVVPDMEGVEVGSPELELGGVRRQWESTGGRRREEEEKIERRESVQVECTCAC